MKPPDLPKPTLYKHKKTGQIHFIVPGPGERMVVTVQANVMTPNIETHSWLGTESEFAKEFWRVT